VTATQPLLTKQDVLKITRVTFPTIWTWMRAGKFPRSRIVVGKSMWLSSEVDAWLAALPLRPLKGDALPDEAPRKRRTSSLSNPTEIKSTRFHGGV
jgi:predicted DNA-binding transcriptional regulator AlpA